MEFKKVVEMNGDDTIKSLYGFPVIQSENNLPDFELKLGLDILEPYTRFYLDCHETGNWLIKINQSVYHAGYNKESAMNLIERLNNTHRPNIEEINNCLYICWNHHEKHENCEYILEIENCCIRD